MNNYIGNLNSILTKNYRYFIDSNTKNIFLSSPELDFLLDYFNKNRLLKLDWKVQEVDTICKKNKFSHTKLIGEIERLKFLLKNKLILPKNEVPNFYCNIDKSLVDSNIANTKQIVIQTTESCNLNCKYCIDGSFYHCKHSSPKCSLKDDICISFVKHVLSLKKSKLNHSKNNILVVSFYGGEPLLNFNLIKSVVNYIDSIDKGDLKIKYSMTTNGVLLDKYSPFLVEKEFNISISLDGNEQNNEHRVFHNGKGSFDIIYKNIVNLRSQFPEYFNENISFLSVLHDKNDVADLYEFFIAKFNKVPKISTLNKDELDSVHKKEFSTIYKTINLDATTKKKLKNKSKYLYDGNFNTDNILSNLFLKEYSSLDDLFNFSDFGRFPVGTCMPFLTRIYLSAKGLLYPCERVNSKYVFGKCDAQGIKIFYDDIIAYYNEMIINYQKNCKLCLNQTICSTCYFCNSENFSASIKSCFTSTKKLINQARDFLETNEVEVPHAFQK